ncbi:MAG TPA: hypothetical protein VHN20_12085 [Beijerinckiaceae bacterium]|nr:hypothetical protein [Beijerinckiaceae bacterium]
MPLSTSSDLQAAVADWLARADLGASIPDFVRLAEARLNLLLRCREMTASATLAPAAGICVLPADFVEALAAVANAGPSAVLEAVPLSWGDAQFPTYPTGTPRYYALYGASLKTYPQSSATVTLTYLQALPPLAANASNWLLAKAPGAYLYGALLEAAPFLDDDPRVALWAQMWQRIVGELNAADQRAVLGRNSARATGLMP